MTSVNLILSTRHRIGWCIAPYDLLGGQLEFSMAFNISPFRNLLNQRFARSYHDYIRYAHPGESFPKVGFVPVPSTCNQLQGGTVRLPLASSKVIGVANSRGNRR